MFILINKAMKYFWNYYDKMPKFLYVLILFWTRKISYWHKTKKTLFKRNRVNHDSAIKIFLVEIRSNLQVKKKQIISFQIYFKNICRLF